MSKSDFNIICSSKDGVGLNPNNKTFYYDFFSQPDGFYELSFSFVAGNNDLEPSIPALLNITNFATKNYQATSTSYSPVSSTIGLLYPTLIGVGVGFLQASANQNVSTIIRRPPQNQFTVQVINIANSTCAFTADTVTGTNTINVTAVSSVNISVGQVLTGAGIPLGAYIVSGPTGNNLGVYTISLPATATATGIAMVGVGPIGNALWQDNAGLQLSPYTLILKFKKIADV